MFILYYKELHIVKEPMLKNRTHQTWRGKQLIMSECEETLQEYIDRQPDKDRYYIEKLPK